MRLPPHRQFLASIGTAGLIALVAGIAHDQAPSGPNAAGVVYTADERGNSISALDLASGPLADVAVGGRPARVVADPQGRRAFITNAGDNAVSVVDLARNEVVAMVGTARYPHGLRMSPDGRELYVANVQDGSVSVIDVRVLVDVARIPRGKTPVQPRFTPDGRRVDASLRDEKLVAVIDTATRTVVGLVPVRGNPIQVHATPDGRFVYVAHHGTEAEPAHTVSVIGLVTGSVVDTIRTAKGARGVAVSEDGAFAFVTNIVDGTVSVIDAVAGRVVASVAVARGPDGVTYRPAGGTPKGA